MNPHEYAAKKYSLLNKLRKAVKKLNFLLITSTYKLSQWSLASISTLRTPPTMRRYTRHLSFNNVLGRGIYHGCSEDDASELLNQDCTNDHNNNKRLSSIRSFTRMKNNGLSNDSNVTTEDIDFRADMFIQNFHRQLRMERQISLELRYCNNDNNNNNSVY